MVNDGNKLLVDGSAVPDEAPLTPQQWRLWFLHQLNPETAAYNVTKPVRIEGPLNATMLRQVVERLVDRHEALRTRIVVKAGQPVQRVEPPIAVDMPVVDLSGFPASAWNLARHLVALDAVRPFDMTRVPMLRTAMLRLSGSDHVLLLTLHHIASDAFSLAILIDEMSSLCSTRVTGRPDALPPVAVQYRHFAATNRGEVDRVMAKGAAYWRRHLAAAPSPLEWAGCGGNSTVRGTGHESFVISSALMRGLHEVQRATSSRPFALLLTAYAVTLAQACRRDDLVIGISVANRFTAPLQKVVGFLAGTLPQRVDMRDNPDFATLLGRTTRNAWDALDLQTYPLEKIVELVCPDRAGRRNPLFQVFFVLQSASSPRLGIPHVTLTDVPLLGSSGMFDIILSIQPAGTGFSGSLIYDKRLLSAPFVRGLARRYLDVLGRACARRVSRVLDEPAAASIASASIKPITQAEWMMLANDDPADGSTSGPWVPTD